MLACISPAARDLPHTLATLRYASSARRVRAGALHRVAERMETVSDDPMLGDVDDPDARLQRRAAWLEVPGFGDVFARVAGDSARPLLLYVHGPSRAKPASRSLRARTLNATGQSRVTLSLL